MNVSWLSLTQARAGSLSHRPGRERLESALGSALAASEEFKSILGENDPEMFYEGLLQLGQKVEAEGRIAEAAELFAAIVQAPPAALTDPVRAIQRRAQEHWDAMTGNGASVYRSEFLLRGVAEQATEPTGLVGLTAAGTVFRATRLAALARLAGSPTATLLTRGVGAELAAGILGFGAEALTFPLAGRGAAALLGRDLDWSADRVGAEIAGSFLLLGAMKLGAGATSRLGRGLAGAVFRQAGLLGGIALGHRLETAAGLRQPRDAAMSLADSLAILLQVNVAGRLAQGIMGEGFRNWESELEGRTLRLSGDRRPGFRFPPFFGEGAGPFGELALLGSGNSHGTLRPQGERAPILASERFRDLVPHVMSMAADPALGGAARRRPEAPEPELAETIQAILELPPEAGGWDMGPEYRTQKFLNDLFSGAIQYRRLTALHRFLAGGRPLDELTVVDNGPGVQPSLSFTLARLGSRVLVKEPGSIARHHHEKNLRKGAAPEIRERIRYVDGEELHGAHPADIAYWSHPDPFHMQFPGGTNLFDYMGRDVAEGGYLVLETDHSGGAGSRYLNLVYDPSQWERVFSGSLPNIEGHYNFILPTIQYYDFHLQIFRRLEAAHSVSGINWHEPAGDLPYRRDERDRFIIPGIRNVVVLGDATGSRYRQLSSQGHSVMHITFPDPVMSQARRYMAHGDEDSANGGLPAIEFKWEQYKYSSAHADYVEAVFPEILGELKTVPSPERAATLRDFLERIVNSKVKPGGVALILSERHEIVHELGQMVAAAPHLEILEVGRRNPTLRSDRVERFSESGVLDHTYLMYRVNAPAEPTLP